MYLKIKKQRAEEIRKKLIKDEIYDTCGKILYDGDFVLFPIKKEFIIENSEIIDIPLKKLVRKPYSLKESLKDKLTEDELKLLPSSYDLIGDIAVLEIPDELKNKGELIGNSLLETFKNIKVVADKRSNVGTEFRTRMVRVIAGENRTETIHKEQGCVYKLDVENSYFSPRSGTERMRVVKQIKDDEKVLVMFAGIGPFAILAAKNTDADVFAIELNPDAAGYMKENIKLNKVNVHAICGDVRIETPKLIKNFVKFDRIIMPLPKDAEHFLDVALSGVKIGGIIHFYCFAHTTEDASLKVKEICEKLNYEIEILDAVECGSYSPCLSRMCVDFRVVAKNSG
ncbi:MAG: tRNA (guanine-N1)-methyltransferase [Candidatus Altiarchaeales archaeon HGW-Altiarchaeales-3]|nr:MAG: tRNA (guanine-N1)-methyltransferase [Candidatus Altiarchaeales archaeon HGW-Altiarchaeales-3]